MIGRRALVAVAAVLAACSTSTGGPSTVRPASTGVTTGPASTAVTTTVVAPSPPTTAESTAPGAGGPCGHGGSPPARYDHVVWIWMENHTAGQVLGSPSAPFETGLAAECGSATNYRDVGSPSLPNYLGATSGSTHGVHDDGSPASHPVAGDNLFRQVGAAGGTARSYEEAMPANCSLTGSGRYAVKHNPQAYYSDPDDRAACQRDNVPLGSLETGALADDLAHDRLPTFSFVTPDLCNDTHDCGVAVGDRWLEGWVGRLLESATYRAGRLAVLVVWDEPTPMPLLVVSPTTPPGSTAAAAYDHYALLRTTEEMLGLAPLGAAASAADIRASYGL
jgi:Phosphoesterase family